MSGNPIKYTSRTYNSIMNDINSDSELVDKPSWWKRIWAGIGDALSMWLNGQANQSYLDTAFTEKAVDKLVALIDYQRTARTTSSGQALFYVDTSASFPFTVNRSDLVAMSESSAVISSLRFEAASNETFTASSETFTVNATSDLLTVASVYITGELVRLTTTNTLPAGLAIDTDYYVIYASDTTIYLATSLTNAYAGIYIDITDAGTGTHTIHRYSKVVTLYQMELKENIVIGTSDGITEWQKFIVPEINIIIANFSIVINSVSWTRVTTFVNSTASDKHYKINYLTDGTFEVVFGDGTYGEIPGAFDVYCTYGIGGGINSNVSTIGRINSYGGNDSNITGVSNPETFTGGGNRETKESATIIAPILLKARDRFVTVEDGEAIAFNYGGISRVKINKNIYGLLSCQVLIVPNGGGLPSSTLKTAIEDLLIEKSILEAIDVRCDDPTYDTTNLEINIHPTEGYSFTDIYDMIEFACMLLISELTYELQQYYLSNGIINVTTYINTLWGYSFTSDDYTEIARLLDEVNAPNFGQNIEESDFMSLIDGITGVDYLTVTTPASFPITFGSDEIPTPGTITINEI